MANQYDTNLKLQAIADAIGDTSSSGLISALEDIADAVAGGGGGSSAGLVSDNFSETDTYDLGDYCIHNNTLYVCINAITTPGPWDLSDWQATNAGQELSSLNSALYELDYANKVDLSQTLNVDGATYTVPKKGIIRVLANTTADGDAYYVLRNMNIVTSGYMGFIAYQRSSQQLEGYLNESIVNIGDIIKCEGIVNKTLNLCLFIPFK
jgi:hypothetical protein